MTDELTAEQIAKLVSHEWVNGAGVDRIAVRAGISRSSVHRIVSRLGLPPRLPGWNSVNPEIKEKIRQLWAGGLSTRLIGLELGLSKNKIVGHAARMGLPKRPSPLKNPGPYKPREVLSESEQMKLAKEKSDRIREDKERRKQIDMAKRAEIFTPIAPPIVRQFTRGMSCQWVIGDPSKLEFCQDQAISGKPYCLAHCERAYTGKTASDRVVTRCQ